jgi:hypothetical protein
VARIPVFLVALEEPSTGCLLLGAPQSQRREQNRTPAAHVTGKQLQAAPWWLQGCSRTQADSGARQRLVQVQERHLLDSLLVSFLRSCVAVRMVEQRSEAS